MNNTPDIVDRVRPRHRRRAWRQDNKFRQGHRLGKLAHCLPPPSGAIATIDSLMGPSAEQPTRTVECTTPCSVQVNCNDNLTVSFRKDGYEPQIVPLSKEVAGTGAAGFAGNILLGGVIGTAVDGTSGAALDHKPNRVIVTMQPIAPPPPSIVRSKPKKRAP